MPGPLTHPLTCLPDPGDPDRPSSHPQVSPSLGTADKEPFKRSPGIHCSCLSVSFWLVILWWVKPQEAQRQHTRTRHGDRHKSKCSGQRAKQREHKDTDRGHGRPAPTRSFRWGHNRGPHGTKGRAAPASYQGGGGGWESRGELWHSQVALTQVGCAC